MAIELAQAYVQIIPSAKGISGEMQKTLTPELNDTGDKVGKNFANKFIKSAATAVTAGVAVVGGASASVWSAANKVAEAGDVIDKQSQKVGVSAEQYQAMAFAANHCGFEVNNFSVAAKNLSASGFDGTVWDATNAIMALEDPTERSAMAAELFGNKVAQQMQPLLNSNESLTDYMENLSELGGIMSQDAVSASASFEDALTDLQASFDGVKTNLTASFLPAMTEVMQGLTDMISGKEGGLEKVKQGINDFLQNLSASIPQFTSVAGELILAFIDVFIDNLPQIVQMGVEILGHLVLGIIQSIPSLVAKTPEIITAFINAILGLLPDIIDVGGQIVNGVWKGIENARSTFTANVRSFFSSIVDSVKQSLGIESPSKVFAKEVGHWIPAGVAEGIIKNGDIVGKAMDSVMMDAQTATMDVNSIGAGMSKSAVVGNASLVEGLVNGLSASQNNAPVNVSVELVLQNGQAIAEAIFNDLLNVSKQRGVSLGTA